MAILGIDLGTTNSLGAVYRNNQVELIPNRFGSFLTPSAVSIDDGKILVGQIAKERLVSHPELSAASFKKDMGTKQKYKLGDKEFSPEELSSFVIRSIVDDAKEYLQEEIEEVIVSVPAYFHDKQRVATKKAGVLAGVPVKRIINEPSAAAMASYFETGKEQLFLVFDFGGGTLDVSIVECFDTMVEIISVAGDNRLGGDNFHEVMSANFIKEHGLDEKKVTDKERAILLRKAEECKRALTTEETANMTAIVGGQSYTSVYTNQRLLDESGLLLAKIKDVLAHALRDGGVSVSEIDAVVMVGGSSKMPLIQSYLQHLMKTTPFVTENCDEMIVRGLGLVCAVKARNEEVKDYVLTDICPFTLGTGTYNETSPEHSYMCAIIPRNTVLPCSIVKRLYTVRDNQTRVN
ncbi:MAG: Hsp70 family protein, partial [Agathobacter sp.]|nr:Hsp70 family protein [Agathobacter sp.]